MLKSQLTLRSKESSMTKHGRKKINSRKSSTLLKSRLVFTRQIILAVPACMEFLNLLTTLIQTSSKYMDLIDQNITCVLKLEEDRQSLKLAQDLFRWRIRRNQSSRDLSISILIPILKNNLTVLRTCIPNQSLCFSNL